MRQPELGKKIAALRKSKRITQESLVERSGISVRTIQRIENGEANPRNHTIEKILSALDSNMSVFEIDQSSSKKSSKWLTISWIAGIGYLLLGFIEGPMDFTRLLKDTDLIEVMESSFIPIMDYSENFYVIIKLLVMINYTLFIYGFITIGARTKSYLLKIISIILLSIMVFILSYDIISLYYHSLNSLIVQMIISAAFGVLSIIFGIGLIKLYSSLGLVCVFAGALEIIAGIFFLFTNPIGLPIQMLAGLLEVIIIYKMIQIFDNKAQLPFT
ncbi:helix-turn-helix transcriptional regulator [uncultured Aquimarina sp.]|uniref:helix-turn-helix domain-containing protein n=1 Tax=uncultured Aquimarina sp. TaxID=575652 RepID=UPI002621E710|nr:helix-turn-helix transcriptional regulator [uncultured Aquimarina sp.]